MPFSTKDLYLSLERKVVRSLGPPQVAILSLLSRRRPAAGLPAEPRRLLPIKLRGIGNIVRLGRVRRIERPAASRGDGLYDTDQAAHQREPRL